MSSPSSDTAAVLRLGPLFYCWILGPSIVSSRTSVFYDCVSYAVQEPYGGSSVCGQRPISAGINHRPGLLSTAVGGALRPDTGPWIGHQLPPNVSSCITLLVLKACCYICHLCWGWFLPLHTGLCLLSFGPLPFSPGIYIRSTLSWWASIFSRQASILASSIPKKATRHSTSAMIAHLFGSNHKSDGTWLNKSSNSPNPIIPFLSSCHMI
jgi:hypothetical protein